MNMETRVYKITGITPILGSQPGNENVMTQYITSKAPDGVTDEEYKPALEDKVTIFRRDPKDDALCLCDYMIRGFFKAALNALQSQLDVAASRSKVDKYLFVSPRVIPLLRDDERIYDEDDLCERSLRAQTMQGERTALASSEQVLDPWEIVIEVTLLPNKGSAKSKALTWEAVEEALNYGRFAGLGQWRNGGYGRFEWTEVKQK